MTIPLFKKWFYPFSRYDIPFVVKKRGGWFGIDLLRFFLGEYFKTEKISNSPNLTFGDWNGDGMQDVAVLIEYGSEKVDDKMMPMVWTIAFIKSANGYSYFKLEGGDYLQTVKKGKKDFNAETNKSFIHKTDAIFSGIWEKSGTVYVWDKTKFKSVITSD